MQEGKKLPVKGHRFVAGELKPLVFSQDRRDGPDGEILISIRDLFETDPGVGFAIVDIHGVFRYANPRWSSLFLEGVGPTEIVGRSMDELFGNQWAAERLGVLRRIVDTRRPAVLRHIRLGQRLQSTIRLISQCDEVDEPCTFSVTTCVGTHDLSSGADMEIVDSGIVHLGPLDPLSARELEVLTLIGHGMTSVQIAESLHRSVRTVEQHSASIRRKLKTTSRVEMAAFAIRAGLTLADLDKKRVRD